MEAILRYMLDKLPGTQIVLNSLLPRSKTSGYDYIQPSIFTAAISAVNDKYE